MQGRKNIDSRKGENRRYVTSFERLAREEGIQLGIQLGVPQGVLLGERNMLLRQLKNKFSSVPEPYFQRIQKADSESLMTWCERMLDSDALEQIFVES